MKAKAIVNKLLEAGLDDPSTNLARHSADIYQQRRYGPKHLIAQPESCDAITAAHFDMWNDERDPEVEPWDWNDPRAVEQVRLLIDEWASVPGMNREDLQRVAGMYLTSGDSETFRMMADLFVNAGYSVYHSNTVFEVYDPKQLTEEENIGEEDEEQ